MKRHKFSFLLITLILFIVVSFVYGKAFFHPNEYLFGADADAMKNYYTYQSYIKNNVDDIEFNMMNYPYGEHFLYTDCHPLQAFLLKKLTYVFPSLSNYTIGLLNCFMFLSIWITAFLLYLIFDKLKVNSILAIGASVSIAILSPQIERIGGHFALSYSFFIPLTIYLLLLYEESDKKIKIAIVLAVTLLVYFFTHAYLGMIATTLVLAYLGLSLLGYLSSAKLAELKKYAFFLFTSLVPIGLFILFLSLTDQHVGRTTNPWGIFENHADFNTVFLPNTSNVLFDLRLLFPNMSNQVWEGRAYIGIVAIVILSLASFYFILQLIALKKDRIFQLVKTHKILIQLLVASILILFFSMLWPFRETQYKVVDHLNFIKQFRAIGRFAWVFFFVANIVAVFLIDKWFAYIIRKKFQSLAYTVVIIIPIIIFIEGISQHQNISTKITLSPNMFQLESNSPSFQSDIKSIEKGKYQAIIPLPYFYIGSENFGKTSSNHIYQLSFLFSYHLNLPLTASYLTRTGIEESKNLMQLISTEEFPKKVRFDMKSNKPFLIVCSNEFLNQNEIELISKAKLIRKNKTYSLYEIGKGQLFHHNQNEHISRFNRSKPILHKQGEFYLSDTTLFWQSIDFDKSKKYSFGASNGCFEGAQKDFSLLYTIEGKNIDTSKQYIARFWMHNSGANYGQDCLNGMVFFQKEKDGKVEWLNPQVNPGTSHQILENWSLIEVPLKISDTDANYSLILKGADNAKLNYYLDKLLFFDTELEIYNIEKVNQTHFLYYKNNLISSDFKLN